MKIGTEDRKKLALAGTLGIVALSAVIYNFAAGGGTDSSPATPVPTPATGNNIARNLPTPSGTAAAKISRSTMDPTLHPEGMELTESLLYSGTGRNIFSASSAPALKEVRIEKPLAPVRPPILAPVSSGPPPLPAIDLRFFGTATRPNGSRQAFFLKGDDVFLASEEIS